MQVLDLVHQIPQRPPEPVESPDDDGVPVPKKVVEMCQLGALCDRRGDVDQDSGADQTASRSASSCSCVF
jgi:hypothetical protein